MEVDLSDNILNEIPIDLFVGKDVEILRVAGKSDGICFKMLFKRENLKSDIYIHE